jgi:16S rRNA (guanine966-N2)-methyltransferase
MTRVIAGESGGRRLRTPAGDATRPTSDRVREALFSAVVSELGTLSGRRFLDVYAGSGAVGLEARSRGASGVTLVEQAPAALAAIRANIAALGYHDVDVLAARAERMSDHGARSGPGFDVAFFDPPYKVDSTQLAAIVADLGQTGWFADRALVIVERGRRQGWTWPSGLIAVRDRRYGETMLWYGRWALPVAKED